MAIFLYSFAWIPAIIATIIFAIKKGTNQKRNLVISIAIGLTSFLVFIWINSSSEQLTELHIEWDSSEYSIDETVEITLSPVPENAKIETLSISENSIADLKYEDEKAIISFKAEGSESLYFIANDKIKSNKKSIKVIDAKAEAEHKAEEERLAEEQAEAERIAAEQAEAERIAAEQAEAKRIAAEQAAQEQAQLEEQKKAEEAAEQAQTPQETMVWIPTSGSKYHSNASCSGMNNPSQVTISQAQASGYEPCKKCY